MAKRLICVVMGLFFFVSVSAQFPEGVYTGSLYLEPRTLGFDSIPLTFTIEKNDNDSNLVWRFEYRGLRSSTKDYRLRYRNNQYELDERNGIVLYGTFENKELRFLYTLDSTLYEVEYDFAASGLVYFDLRFYAIEPSTSTDGLTVNTTRLAGRQYALLKKQ